MKEAVIFCVDDEKVVLNSLRRQLYDALENDIIIETAESGEEALEAFQGLLEQGHDIPLIISDHIMPGMKGDELLAHIHALSPHTLKIMLTGQADMQAVISAVNNAGLYRYISKPWEHTDLFLTVKEALHKYYQEKKLAEQNLQLQQAYRELEVYASTLEQRVAERTAELENANQQLQRLANLDGLTQVANRRKFDAYLAQEWKRHVRESQPLSLIMGDIDFFKRYNDTYGHVQGDECLKQIAAALRNNARRPADLVARYGGEEFCVILPNTDEEGAIRVAAGIQTDIQMLRIEHNASDVSPYVTLSIGVATTIPDQRQTADELIETADKALYHAKMQGRDRVIFLPAT
ncbi:putative diguanylate cyclase with GGDEF domain [Candidatus Moduliflexus flocculans]|uniref:Putative diguanylate cyclase with GGDEF domain n=1 Tax=Candidatus Moduliflexus flocculans TaxID=1499966 RepID=A0A081BM91_9BACT|nr:putative diguanylate cyclase with GGDEF domain [Candidatus Moduliflexus flocculans]